MSQIAVVLEDLATHPQCTHGPTILFSRTTTNGAVHKFFACAACRDRKDCAFYLDETAKDTESIVRKERWKVDKQNYVQAIKHRKLFVMYNKVLQLPMIERQFCYTCSTFLVTNSSIHNGHNITVDIDDYHLQHPTEFLSPLDNPKKEAQFLFSKLAVKSIVDILLSLELSTIKLPSEQGYKYCNLCKKWVYNENKHCNICKACTSKDGRTYIHCSSCQRCVKPTWKHCDVCQRCAQPDHRCQELTFSQACFHCKEMGHKKRQCPQINHEHLRLKRSKGVKTKSKKRKQLYTLQHSK